MVFLVLSELANAFSMLSPLVCWFRQRRQHSQRKMHKMMIVHIPISIMYHVVCAIPSMRHKVVRRLLKITDLVLIHVFSLTAAKEIHDVVGHVVHVGAVARLPRSLNTLCIYRISRGNEDKWLRLAAVYSCVHYGLKHNKNKRKQLQIYAIGTLACTFYLLDAKLYNFGHSLFHVVLGVLQCQLFGLLLGEGNASKALLNS